MIGKPKTPIQTIIPPIDFDDVADFEPAEHHSKRHDEKGRHIEFAPTKGQRVMVSALAACNVRNEGIAAFIGIDDKTLRKYFGDELEHGYAHVEAHLTGMLSKKAFEGNLTAIFFLLRCKFGWHENPRPVEDGITIDQLSDAAKTQLIVTLRASVDADKAGARPHKEEQATLGPAAGPADGSG